MIRIPRCALAVGALLLAGHAGPVVAQVNRSGYRLPLDLALEAAQEAARRCLADGHEVTVTVVDSSGVPQVVLRTDGATIHTRETSFRKAYTVVTLGPVLRFETAGAFAALVTRSPANGAALSSVANVIPLAGAVAFLARGEIVAALGVGGAPGGDRDEVCAEAGVARVRERLPRAAP